MLGSGQPNQRYTITAEQHGEDAAGHEIDSGSLAKESQARDSSFGAGCKEKSH